MSNITTQSESVIASEANKKRVPGVAGGKAKVIYDAVTLDYDAVAGDLFKMENLPANVRIVDAYVKGPAKTTGIFDLGLLNAAGTALEATKIVVKGMDMDGTANFKRADALSTYLNTYNDGSVNLYLACTESMTALEGADTKIELVVEYTLD